MRVCTRTYSSIIGLILVGVALVGTGCGSSGFTVPATYITKERLRLGYKTVVIRELTGSWSAFEKTGYVPAYRFAMLDEKGVTVCEWVGALHFEQSLLNQSAQVLLAKDSKVDSLRTSTLWRFSDTLHVHTTAGTAPAITQYWSVDSTAAGAIFEKYRLPVGEGGSGGRIAAVPDASAMKKIMEEAGKYVYFDIKRYVISTVAEM